MLDTWAKNMALGVEVKVVFCVLEEKHCHNSVLAIFNLKSLSDALDQK